MTNDYLATLSVTTIDELKTRCDFWSMQALLQAQQLEADIRLFLIRLARKLKTLTLADEGPFNRRLAKMSLGQLTQMITVQMPTLCRDDQWRLCRSGRNELAHLTLRRIAMARSATQFMSIERQLYQVHDSIRACRDDVERWLEAVTPRTRQQIKAMRKEFAPYLQRAHSTPA